MTPTAEERTATAFSIWRDGKDDLRAVVADALRLAYADGKRDEREACAVEIEQLAVAQGNAECCGFGVGSPPECCADPVYMISGSLAASAIRSRTDKESSDD